MNPVFRASLLSAGEGWLTLISVLSETRVTFDRISAALSQFYHTAPTLDPTFKFNPIVCSMILSGGAKTMKPAPRHIPPPPWPSQPPPVIHSSPHLTPAQSQAAALALSQSISIVNGPPFTGNTHCAVAIVTAWLDRTPYKKVFVTTDGNTAADNFHIAISATGVAAFRLATWKVLTEVPDDMLDDLTSVL